MKRAGVRSPVSAVDRRWTGTDGRGSGFVAAETRRAGSTEWHIGGSSDRSNIARRSELISPDAPSPIRSAVDVAVGVKLQSCRSAHLCRGVRRRSRAFRSRRRHHPAGRQPEPAEILYRRRTVQHATDETCWRCRVRTAFNGQ